MTHATALPLKVNDLLAHSLDRNMLDYWLAKLNPRWSVFKAQATVVDKQQAAVDSISLLIKPNRHLHWPEAGQHLMVGAEVNGRCVYRSYSCSDVTGRPDLLEITVKQVNGGKLSHWLCQHARVGDVLQLQQPFGELVWPSTSQSVILLAAGSGITPLISLLRQHVQQSHHQHTNNQAIELHYWVSRAEQACFTEELNALTTILPNFKFYLYITQQTTHEISQPLMHTPSNVRYGRIDASHFASLEDLNHSAVVACGSADFVANAKQILHPALQPQVASWQAESFSPPQLSVLNATNDQQQTVQIFLQKQQRSIGVPVGQSILMALENEGIAHPSGCRMGLCNTCACGKISGTTQHLISGDQQHDADSALRICVNTAQTDLVLDI